MTSTFGTIHHVEDLKHTLPRAAREPLQEFAESTQPRKGRSPSAYGLLMGRGGVTFRLVGTYRRLGNAVKARESWKQHGTTTWIVVAPGFTLLPVRER